MSIPQAASTFLQVLSVRRSTYTLAKTPSILSVDQIQTILSKVLRASPSSYNSKSPRLVLLVGAEHDEYWGKLVPTALTNAIKSSGGDEKAVEAALARVNMFKPAFGTVLFFESQNSVKGLQEKLPQYKDIFPVWSEHASAIAQNNTWVALTNAGYGANLQHYGNLTQEQIKKKFSLPNDWNLKAELVFGAKTAEPKPKEYDEEKENEERLKIFGA
ncbi:related to oxidoreductase related to nitroreductase [Melanopsichium pennsylvanicum]|uniref:Related to oxidoreductase related to nitroreductase n=2 Tax=Melanopsichium pennsylvanicum TaxID=63383 RepID=A0AAJ5C5A1_9BASI|nr:nitroreductase family protein [Melanopsichium pennsylvanicum 4]SNX84358.1 related to oxidoreductase related to nitroreductase [Melanopsichium pennsylvanicum]